MSNEKPLLTLDMNRLDQELRASPEVIRLLSGNSPFANTSPFRWLIGKILAALNIENLFEIFPFKPVVTVERGDDGIASVVIAATVTVNGRRGTGMFKGDIVDIHNLGLLNVVRSVMEDAITEAFVGGKKNGTP